MSRRKLKLILMEGGIALAILSAFSLYGWTIVVDTNAKFEFAGLQAYDQIGSAVTVAGDTDGDGYDDYVISAPYAANHATFTPQYNNGYVSTFSGKNGKRLRATSGGNGEQHGLSVTALNDLDQDGLPETVIGSPGYDAYRGKVTVYTRTQTFELPGQRLNEGFGYRVARAGDVNGDGKEDLLVLAPWQSNRVYLFSGSLIAQSQTSPLTFIENASFYNASGAGDINRDGFADIAVGAYGLKRVYVYYGQATGLNPNPTIISSTTNYFGQVVASAGDLNRDGFGDLAVSAPYVSVPAGFAAGKVFFYAGSATGIATTPFAQIDSPIPYAYLGASMAAAGDSNCNDKNEILISAPGYGNTEGFVYLYSYDPNTATMGLQKTFASGIAGEYFGQNISAKINARSGWVQTKILIGAPYASPPTPFQSPWNAAGKAYAYELSCRRSLWPAEIAVE